jgi:hypothetical protein
MDDIKILLGDAQGNFSDDQIKLCLKHAQAEVKSYCNRELDEELEICAQKIAIIKLNRMNTEGLVSQGYSGVSENYIDGYPADIMALLNRKRKIKVV